MGGCFWEWRGEEEAGRDMGLLTNRVERSEISPGDHIYTWRAVFTYSHHGISDFAEICFSIMAMCCLWSSTLWVLTGSCFFLHFSVPI